MGFITLGNQSVGTIGSHPYCVVPDLGVVIAGLLFMIVHALYVGIFAKPKKTFAENDSPAVVAAVPERVPRHSFVARAFHWVMAISMFALLITAFLPKVGVKFDWVTYHWIAGLVLTASVIFHIVHASFCPGLLVHLARQDRPARREEKDDAGVRQRCAAAGPVCEISAGEQVLSLRDFVCPAWP